MVSPGQRSVSRLRHLARSLLPLPHVQFWETENGWRLDSSHRGGRGRNIPCLVDASDVRTLNALKTPSRGSMSATAIYRKPSDPLSFGDGKTIRVFDLREHVKRRVAGERAGRRGHGDVAAAGTCGNIGDQSGIQFNGEGRGNSVE